MSFLTSVLDEARTGATTARIAVRLAAPESLVEAAMDHWVRLGVVTSAGTACGTCAPRPEDPVCAGCAVARLPRLPHAPRR